MTIETKRIAAVIAAARARGASVLLETEGLELLAALGVTAPRYVFVRNAESALTADTSALGGERVVVKVISPNILHKSDVGGVKIVAHKRALMAEAVRDMETRLGQKGIVGFTISECVRYDQTLGNELILGLRWTDDFGPVVTLGAGGIYTEFLAQNFPKGRELGVFSPGDSTADDIARTISELAVGRLATGRMRGQEPRISVEAIAASIGRFLELAKLFSPQDIAECEINPLVITPTGLVALDILVKLGTQKAASGRPERPLAKLRHLLEPKSAAIIGVSEKGMNPGRIILQNLIREGFDQSRTYIVKDGLDSLDGCRCVPSIADLPERVDLCILAISAAQTPEAITDIVEGQKAESVIVIPGGLEEKAGTEAIVARMREALFASRKSEWGGPLINGGNCLGVRSRPGRYDTLFIPQHKLPVPDAPETPLALISQSGAFAVARLSKLGQLNMRYAITLGNQMDLTVSDYLTYLQADPKVDVFAVYVEGFAPLDGQAFLRAARAITASGRTVILYRAGRTAAGAKASASHTASMAGDYAVTRALAKAAGVVMAESLSDFEDLVKLFVMLRGKQAAGFRLGAVSNAGFECVAMADNLGAFELLPFDAAASAKLLEIFKDVRIDKLVDVHNPIDITPMAADAAYEAVSRVMLEADTVDVGIVGLVPLSGALQTLAAGAGHNEDITRVEGVGPLLAKLHRLSTKAWIIVVDAGRLYDPLAALLDQQGVPTFRATDTALRLFNMFVAQRCRPGR
jgi:acyl-CoA synthetase (NDP forming)